MRILASRLFYSQRKKPASRLKAVRMSVALPRNTVFNGVSIFSCDIHKYRVSQEERTKLRESVPYVKLYRYDPKHLYPKLNGYGDNGQRKVWTFCISAYCTSTAV